MTTFRTRAFVSLAATVVLTVALGACAGAPARETLPEERLHAVRFDNDGRDPVHVYLVSERWQWLLGRVAPGAIATLRIPPVALDEHSGLVKLVVIAGERVTLQAARDGRAQSTIAQPASDILSQQWRFAQGQLTSLALPASRRRMQPPDDDEGANR